MSEIEALQIFEDESEEPQRVDTDANTSQIFKSELPQYTKQNTETIANQN